MFKKKFNKICKSKKNSKDLMVCNESIKEENVFDINISKEGDIFRIEVSDYISLYDYVERMKLIDNDNVSDLISSSIWWNSSKQCINKEFYYVIIVDNMTYSILINDDELIIDEKEKKIIGEGKKTLKFNKSNGDYEYFRCEHDKWKSSYNTKYYSKIGTNMNMLVLSKKETFSDIYYLLSNLGKIDGIDNIIDINLLRKMILGDLLSSLEDQTYYVYEKYEGFKACRFAKYNYEYGVFYNYKQSDDCLETYGKEFEIGQRVVIDDGDTVYCYPLEVDDKIVEATNKINQKYAEWEKKHPDLWPEEQEIPNTELIVNEYIENKIQSSDFTDSYVIGIVHLLYKLIGIKVRHRHGKSLYLQRGLDYPEQVYETIDVLYDLNSDMLDNLKDNEQLELVLYANGLKSLAYEKLINELHRRTGYYFCSDHQDRIDSLYYHSVFNKYEKLCQQRPAVFINKDMCIYDCDTRDIGSVKEEITSKQCKERYFSGYKTGITKALKK